MESKESNQSVIASNKKKPRPAQRLYVPPAQRNKRQNSKQPEDKVESKENTDNLICDKIPEEIKDADEIKTVEEMKIIKEMKPTEEIKIMEGEVLHQQQTMENLKKDTITQKPDNSLIETHIKNAENLKISETKSDIDGEHEEMQRAIVNINRKTRPLIKHVSVVKNDILHIDVEKKTVCKLNIHLNEVSNWEDLFNEDDDVNGDFVNQIDKQAPIIPVDDNNDDDASVHKRNKSIEDLEHVIELYDFPSTFRSQDIMQLYHEIQKEAIMYIKWCDDNHALLVFSTPALAQRALNIRNDVIKSRPLTEASGVAYQTAMKADLKPAMKRPPTTMQTARRLINTHLGTRTKISKEEQEKEREMLRKAKELKKSQRRNEEDAWEGYSRPSTA